MLEFGVRMKAVCIKCGEFKESAWVRCKSCNYRPVSEEEKAQFLLLSTHFNSETKLKNFSEHIKSGKEIDFKPKDLAFVTEVLKQRYTSKSEQRKYIIKLCACFLLTVLFMVIFYYYQASKR